MSRIYGGIHYRFDNTEGQRTGRLVADYIMDNYLLPTDRLPWLRVEGIVDGQIRLRVHGQLGDSFVLESSNDLTQWDFVATVTAWPGGTLISPTIVPSVGTAFYRIRSSP
jgi:hypothetical protein